MFAPAGAGLTQASSAQEAGRQRWNDGRSASSDKPGAGVATAISGTLSSTFIQIADDFASGDGGELDVVPVTGDGAPSPDGRGALLQEFVDGQRRQAR